MTSWLRIYQIHSNIFRVNRNIHDYDVRSADDIYVPYGRLDIRRYDIRIAGTNLWNTLPQYKKKNASFIHIFKGGLKNCLLDKRLYSWYDVVWF